MSASTDPKPAAMLAYARPSTPIRALTGDVDSIFEELEITQELGGVTQIRHARENSYGQMSLLGGSALAFVLFVALLMPMMRLTVWGNIVWILVGLAILVALGFFAQIVLRVTLIRLTTTGLEIEQGTPADQEKISVDWSEVAGIDLEPVDPKDGRKGMQLRLTPRAGEPIDTLAGVAIGDLNALRQWLHAEWRSRQAGNVVAGNGHAS